MNSTHDVKLLVEGVLVRHPNPRCEDVINDVFRLIAGNSADRARYEELCGVHGRDVVNQFGGHWIAKAVDGTALQQVKADHGLTESYSKLQWP